MSRRSKAAAAIGATVMLLCSSAPAAFAEAPAQPEAEHTVQPIEISTSSFEPYDQFLERLLAENDPNAVSGLLDRTATALETGQDVEFKDAEEYEPEVLAEYLAGASDQIDAAIESGVSPDAVASQQFEIAPAYVTKDPTALMPVGDVKPNTARRTWMTQGSMDYMSCKLICTVPDSVKFTLTIDPGFSGTRVGWKTVNMPAGGKLSKLKMTATTYRNQYANGTKVGSMSKSGSGSFTVPHTTNTKGNGFVVAFLGSWTANGILVPHLPARTNYGACSSNPTTGFCTFDK